MKRFLLAIVMLLLSSLALAAVNINTATKEELDALPGIGPVKAQAIIDYRNANGRFKSLEDLKKVNGIGDATFEKLKPDISLTGKTTPVAAAAKSEPAKAPAATPAAPPAKAEPAKTAAPAPAPAATPAAPAPAAKAEAPKAAKEDKAAKEKADKEAKAKADADAKAKAKADAAAKDTKAKDAKAKDATAKAAEAPKK
jgi:competence protein ComEA